MTVLEHATKPAKKEKKRPDAQADGAGKVGTVSPEESESTRTSKSSDKPSRRSKKRWQKPADAKALAAQAREVAVMMLNDEMPLEQARTYASLMRVVSQLVTAEVMRSRYLKEAPNLNFDEE